jgi:rhamnulokinase
LPVIAGPAEATVIGNILVQAVARGRFASLSEARQYVAGYMKLKRFLPEQSPKSLEMARRYKSLEQKFLA